MLADEYHIIYIYIYYRDRYGYVTLKIRLMQMMIQYNRIIAGEESKMTKVMRTNNVFVNVREKTCTQTHQKRHENSR